MNNQQSPPPISIYPPRIRGLVQKLKTPVDVQRWLETLRYNPADTMRTIESVSRTRSAHCLEGAMAAAAILEQHGYPPLILDLESKDRLDHTLLLFRVKGKYGTVGVSRDIGLNGRKPVFSTVRSLAASYAIPYIDAKAELTSYGVLNLASLSRAPWRTSQRNVWQVEAALARIRHYKIILPAGVAKFWRHKYVLFKQHYPNRQPAYYPDWDCWL